MKTLLLLALLICGNAFAKSNIEKIEVYPPFLAAGCGNQDLDKVGTTGLKLTKGSAYIVEDRIAIVFTNQLVLCTDLDQNGSRTKMRWVNVDPFTGFDVPFYNHNTNQSDTFHQVLISSDSSNKFEIRYLSEDPYKVITTAQMISKNNGSIEGTLTIAQSDLLDQNDIDLLDQGKEVSKRLQLDHLSVMTRIYKDPRLNDVTETVWSSRYVKFTFKKVNGQVKIQSFSIN